MGSFDDVDLLKARIILYSPLILSDAPIVPRAAVASLVEDDIGTRGGSWCGQLVKAALTVLRTMTDAQLRTELRRFSAISEVGVERVVAGVRRYREQVW